MKNETTTKKVLFLLCNKYNKSELCEIMGMSRPTLYTRLRLNNWKKTEIKFIELL